MLKKHIFKFKKMTTYRIYATRSYPKVLQWQLLWTFDTS